MGFLCILLLSMAVLSISAMDTFLIGEQSTFDPLNHHQLLLLRNSDPRIGNMARARGQKKGSGEMVRSAETRRLYTGTRYGGKKRSIISDEIRSLDDLGKPLRRNSLMDCHYKDCYISARLHFSH